MVADGWQGRGSRATFNSGELSRDQPFQCRDGWALACGAEGMPLRAPLPCPPAVKTTVPAKARAQTPWLQTV